MPTTPEISRITLPSGTTYYLKDATARSEIEQLMEGNLVATIADSLPQASQNTLGKLYLIASNNATGDIYDEYITVTPDDGETYAWEKIGNTDIDLTDYIADEDSVSLDVSGSTTSSSTTGITVANHTVTQGTTSTTAYISKDEVLGSGTTFTNASSSVTFSGGTTDSVLGADTTATVPKVTSTTKYIHASASGAAVAVDTSGSAITDMGTPSSDTFVKSYPGATAKLVTTSIVPTDGTVSIPNVTGNTSVTIPNVTGSTDVSATLISSYGTLPTLTTTVQNETLTIGWDAGALTTGSDVSASKVTLGTALTATNTTLGTALSAAKVGSAVTVATGATASSDTNGATIMTGLGTATTASAVTGLGTPSTETFAKTIKMQTQPTITLTENTTSTDGAEVVTAIGTSGTESVTFNTNDTVTAVTGIGTGTAAAQTITVGTNDKVNAVVDVSGTTSSGATSETLSGTTSGVAVSSHSVTDTGHSHGVSSLSGTISKE